MKATKIPRSLIVQYIKENRIDTLATWMLMRHRFERRAIFYDWSYRKIARLLKVSPNTSRKHVSELIKAGLLVREGRNLRVVGRNALLKPNETPIRILVGSTKKQLMEEGLIRRSPYYRTLSWNASVWEYEYGQFYGSGVYYSETKRRIVKQSSDTLTLSGANLLLATSSCSKIAHA